MPTTAKISIIGLGLIGGSLMKALISARQWTVAGYDADEDTRREAQQQGYLPDADCTAAEVVAGADIIIFSIPFTKILSEVAALKPFFKDGAIITDVSSVRSDLAGRLQKILGSSAIFVGGHPMAGIERHGWSAADGRLFIGKAYVLEKQRQLPADAGRLLEEVVRSLGAHPVWMDARIHDHVAAIISHAPHIIASAMVLEAACDEQGTEARKLAASCFRDMTRVAASGPAMWKSITCENNKEVAGSLKSLSRRLLAVADALEAGDEEKVAGFFDRAHEVKMIWQDEQV